MIKRMRLKFIAITMGALLLLLASILITTNVYMNDRAQYQITDYLNFQAANDGVAPVQNPPPDDNRPINPQELIDGFSVKIDSSGDITAILNEDSNINDVEAREYAVYVLDDGTTEGKIDNLRYIVEDKSYGKIIVFADQSIQDELLRNLLNLSYIIGGISVLLLFVIVIILSKFVTRPVEEAFEKQKRFIADSRHELKTPLSILSANADVLEMEIGHNQWLDQMKVQLQRMNTLIHELLVLARTEAADTSIIFSEFDLSHTVTNAVLPFEVVSFEQNKKISYDIEGGVLYKGDEQSIKKMLEALTDNAVKYANENSTISVKLYTKGAKKIIEIYNEGQGVTQEQKAQLFEKFYRTDDSRARDTGGYGIGLSIVKNIVDMHKGKIEIKSKPGEYTLFRVILNHG